MRSKEKIIKPEPKLGTLETYICFAWWPKKITIDATRYRWVFLERYIRVYQYRETPGVGVMLRYTVNKWVEYRVDFYENRL